MLDPATFTATAIAQLAFNEFVKSGAGELAKKSIAGGIEGAKKLRDLIKSKFAGNQRAESAIAEIEQQGTEASLTKFVKYLDLEMDEDQTFATEIRQIAQQITNNQTVENRQYTNYGRDQINIEKIDGDNTRIGGS
jgi:phosphoribosylformylglycinamidine (FGAM) synthase PurS component